MGCRSRSSSGSCLGDTGRSKRMQTGPEKAKLTSQLCWAGNYVYVRSAAKVAHDTFMATEQSCQKILEVCKGNVLVVAEAVINLQYDRLGVRLSKGRRWQALPFGMSGRRGVGR